MSTNLDLDDKLIDEARRLGGHRTKREAVNSALEEYVRRRIQLEIIDLYGEIEYDVDYDHKAARNRRL